MSMIRMKEGKPILSPSGDWEAKGTSNSCALLVERDPHTDMILEGILGKEMLSDGRIRDGVVISLYTGVGKYGSDPSIKQHRGLALFTPELELIKKLDHPVMSPSGEEDRIDSAGIEDARLLKVGNTFYAWYCGYNGKEGAACAAYSDDLLHWTRVAPLPGNINDTYNKDHVVFQEKLHGKWRMLHRPWGPEFPNVNDMVIRLASSDDLLGPWEDEGEILRAYPVPGRNSWAGAGPCPIPLGNGRYLLLYHTGCSFSNGYRQYDACAALLDFNRYSAEHPEAIVVKRMEPWITPATDWEINRDLRIDIIFPMGNYIYKDNLFMVYGAGDKCTCAGTIPLAELMHDLDAM